MDLIEELHNKLIFYPSKDFLSSPALDGIPYEEVYIKTPDNQKLNGYFLPAEQKTQNTVIYLHGNGENVSSWYLACVEIQKYVPVNVLIVDYRGYGKSTGMPSVKGVNIDAHSMYMYLIDRGYKPENISLYGRSIGGGIALELALKEKVKSIVVQSSFTSLKDIAKELYPIVPDSIIRNDYWNSKESIKKLNCPILISHGDMDEIVAVHHSYELFKLANEPKKLIILNGATHNDVSNYFTKEYFDELKKMFVI